jgi:predicted nucleic acid-binding protein
MIILDTNIVSEMMRPVPEPSVLRWFANSIEDDTHLTAISLAEILLGIELLPVGKRRDVLRAGAERTFAVIPGRVLGFDEKAAAAFSSISSTRRKLGKPISQFDAQIAAIARAHNALLATRDIADFEGCGVRVVNPWEG